ncbi:ROK family transcriptional regulator [Nocardioides cynanchi]|uniref:ROK family transcriptional regulator n=1 Tax=Nocardioides cynanchi TaxID=2558918 RepID=UPI0012440283|nr:ROK family protein [Nocardioides cynanchi]
MPAKTGISHEELRRVNTSALLTWVHHNGPTTRARLTRELGLNRSTIGDLTSLLSENGLVEELRPDQVVATDRVTARRSGRPSLVVSPRIEVGVLALMLDVDRIGVCVVGLGGEMRHRRERLHQPGAHDLQHVVDSAAQMCREVLRAAPETVVLGIGVSIPGLVRSEDGLVHFAPNLGWTDVQFADVFRDEMDLPVVVGNDADLGVLAEHLYGAAVGASEVAYVGGTVGIGGGFLVRGQPLRGVEGYAGEVGHLIVDSQGALCRCGSRGCWETKIGANRLLSSAGRLTGGGLAAVDEVVQAAANGDALAGRALDDAAYWLGFGLRALVRLFNPEVVVLGGTLGQVLEARRTGVMEVLHERDGVDFAQNVSVCAGGLGSDGPLLGAAEAAFAPLLADPVAVMTARLGDRASVPAAGAAGGQAASRPDSPGAA